MTSRVGGKLLLNKVCYLVVFSYKKSRLADEIIPSPPRAVIALFKVIRISDYHNMQNMSVPAIAIQNTAFLLFAAIVTGIKNYLYQY